MMVDVPAQAGFGGGEPKQFAILLVIFVVGCITSQAGLRVGPGAEEEWESI